MQRQVAGQVESRTGGELRLAELIAAMSLATDLGLGQPMEHVVRSCLVGLRLAELHGLDRAGASRYAMQHGLLPAAPS